MTTKEMLRSPAVEDYSKAIFSLQSPGDQPVATNALAERLGITPGSVSAMLGKLDTLGLITHMTYEASMQAFEPGARLLMVTKGVTLSKRGKHPFGAERVVDLLGATREGRDLLARETLDLEVDAVGIHLELVPRLAQLVAEFALVDQVAGGA